MSQGDNNNSRVGQGDLQDDGRPATQRGMLETKEEEDPPEEPFNGTAFAQFQSCPGGRQAQAIFMPFGVPKHDRHSSQYLVDPADELQVPIASIQANDPRTQMKQTHGLCQQRLSKESVMRIGWGEEKEHRQTGAATEQGMDAIPTQQWMRACPMAASGSACFQARIGALSMTRSHAPIR